MPEPTNGHTTNGQAKPFTPDATVNRVQPTLEQLEALRDITHNLTLSRQQLIAALVDPHRSINKECGYPDTIGLDPQYYRDLFDTDPIANRVVQLMPKETMAGGFEVYEDEDSENVTEFEKAWDDLENTLTPNRSWHQGEQGSKIKEMILRADVSSGVGQFGVILLGLDDGRNLQDACDGVEAFVANHRTVLYGRMPDSLMNDHPVPIFSRDSGGEVTCNWKTEQQLRDQDQQDGRVAKGINEAAREGQLTENYLSPDLYAHILGATTESVFLNGSRLTLAARIGRSSGGLGAGALIQGSEGQYVDQLAAGLPTREAKYGPAGPSLSGTDQQYFGVHFGPSQTFSDKASTQRRKLLFLRCFDESLVQVVRYEWNIRNPRFGMPVMYRITLNDPRQPHSGVGLPLATVYVHWSRVIHLADNLHNSEVFGTPRMRPVLNPILDIRKVRGASAEGYWKSCFNLLSFETHPQLGGDVVINKSAVKEMVDDVFNSLQRQFITSGMAVKSIGPSVVDPTSHIQMHKAIICNQLGCPIRVFDGSERGELASSQDDEAWNERCRQRQHNYLTPKVIGPLIDRLVQLGVLPEPEHWDVEWPDMDALGETDKATLCNTNVTAIAAYVAGNCESILPVKTFYTSEKFLGLSDIEAADIIKEVEKLQATEAETQPLTMPQAGGEGGIAAPPPPPPDPMEMAKLQGDTDVKVAKAQGDAAAKGPSPIVVPGGGGPQGGNGFPPKAGGGPAKGGPAPQQAKPGQGAVAKMHGDKPKARAPVKNAIIDNAAKPRSADTRRSQIEDALTEYTDEQLDGLKVYVNDDEGEVILDGMDWYDSGKEIDPLKEVGQLAEELYGEDNVTYQNEGARPMGEGWVTVNYRPDQPRDRGRFATEQGESTALRRKVWQQGGMTYRPIGGKSPTEGVVVSLDRSAGYEKPISESDFKKHGKTILREYLKKVRNDIASGDLDADKTHVGAWHDKSTGRIVLDVNEVYANQREAIHAGRQRKQDAVYDIGKGQEIDLRGTANSLRDAGADYRRGDRRGTGRTGGADAQGDDEGLGVNFNPEGCNQYKACGESGSQKDKQHSKGHELQHAGHMGHEAHEAHEVHDVVSGHGGVHGPEDAAAIVSSKMYGVLSRGVQAVLGKIPGGRKAAAAVSALHDGMRTASEKIIESMQARYGHATTAAILGAGNLASMKVLGPLGTKGKALPAKALIGAIPFVAMAEAGRALGIVGHDTKVERGMEKAGTWIHAVKSAVAKPFKAVGRELSRGGLKAARAAGRMTRKLMSNQEIRNMHRDDPTHNVTLPQQEIDRLGREMVAEMQREFQKLLDEHGKDLGPLDKVIEQAAEHKGDEVENANPEGCNQYKACGEGGGQSLKTSIAREATTPVGQGKSIYMPNVDHDSSGDGVTDAARIGVPAMTVPPPPGIGRLPNLTPHERAAEEAFTSAFEKNPNKLTKDYKDIVLASTKPGEPPTFATDDAKVLSEAWSHADQTIRSENRATLNSPLHQTANAIAKRAFVGHLDTLAAGDNILVTVGGCGAGKGYALKNVPEALSAKTQSKVVWDSAGDQNATENPWIQREAEKRGLNVTYIHVHADPRSQWADPNKGVVSRAANPADGRMVDAKVFADSYAVGARNHHKFYEANKDNAKAKFIFLDNTGKPKLTTGIHPSALKLDRRELAQYAQHVVAESNTAPAHVKRGALMGDRIWKD